MARLFVGLTGGYGSGKSTVLKLFKKIGVKTINSDDLVKKAWKSSSKIYPQLRGVVQEAGLVKKGGKISISRVSDKFFKNKAFRTKIEKIIHPWVFEKIHLACEREKGILIAEIPLLFETGYNRKTDFVITVTASPVNSIARLQKYLGLSSEDWKMRSKAQWPLKKKVEQSDFVIRNDASLKEVRHQVKLVWSILKCIKLSKNK